MDLSRLNPEQRKAVLHVEGPLLILAGAGSGKTNTMTHRIAYLISEKKVPPSQILGLSFTNKASSELKERVKNLVKKVAGERATKGLVVSTFHSLCVRILREYAHLIGYTQNFTILDTSDQEGIVKEILKHINIDAKKFDPSWILFQIGQAKNKFLTGENANHFFDTLKGPKISYDDYSIALQSVYPRYQERLRLLNAMDFDDLLFNTVTLLESNPQVRETLSKRFKYIMVDEYQDTNPSQFRLLEALTSTHHNICVVGDDDQSIYAWRGADPAHILHFDQHFPGTRRIILDQNYRSTEMILKAANEVIAKNPKRFDKSLWSEKGLGSPIHMVAVEDDRAEASMVAEELLKKEEEARLNNVPPKWNRYAILYRSNLQSRIFEENLRLHHIPYKLVGSMSFLDRKEVKDILCYWKLALNPNDDTAIRRIINWPARGIGKTSIEKIYTHAAQQNISFFEAMNDHLALQGMNEKAKAGVKSLASTLQSMRDGIQAIQRSNYVNLDGEFLQAISLWAKNSLDLLGVKQALIDDEEDPAKAQRRFESVEELANSIGMMDLPPYDPEKPTTGENMMQEYLSSLVLNAKDEEDDFNEDKNAVTLMTLHGSKGLEFPIVFLVGLEDGCLPHQRTIDEGTDLSEERRLFYVGITRAQEELYLVRAKNRIRYGKPVPRHPCRFLTDIPSDILLERDESSTPSFQSEDAKKRHEEEVANFFAEIQQRLKAPRT
jgi:superfamily I DNA/RNA helicase